MSDNTEKEKKTQFIHSPFEFDEYVSPNPRPIALGIKYKPSPLVEYKTMKQTECEPISQSNSTEHKSESFLVENISDSPNAIKQKIKQKQDELQFLQSQLDKLQIQKNKSNKSPKSEQNNSIIFDQSVQINNKKCLASRLIKKTDNKSYILHKKDLSSRACYRTTPIPHKPKRRIAHNMGLPKIHDNNDNNNKENTESINKNDEHKISENENVFELFDTPNIKSNKFSLGTQISPSNSTHASPKSKSASFLISTPIVTPHPDDKTNNPFQFTWNNENNQ